LLAPSIRATDNAPEAPEMSDTALRQKGDRMTERSQPWHHRPAHRFIPGGTYMVTAGTLHKELFFRDTERLRLLESQLFRSLYSKQWSPEAWALFANHYHFVARAGEGPTGLKELIGELHSITARELNRLDGLEGRKIWFQYWDTCLTYEKSYYARLNYVHTNAVKHGLVKTAEDYPFCSASWFAEHGDPGFVRKVRSFRCDRVKVEDDF
jgi:putative transposase